MIEPKEYTLTTDEFLKPKQLKGKAAVAQLLLHLILLEPGTLTNFPLMGVGIVSRYRYSDTANLKKLKTDIFDQINTYLPEFNAVDVKLSVGVDNNLIIDIQIDDTVYKFETSKQEDNKIGLDDLTTY